MNCPLCNRELSDKENRYICSQCNAVIYKHDISDGNDMIVRIKPPKDGLLRSALWAILPFIEEDFPQGLDSDGVTPEYRNAYKLVLEALK